MDGDAINGFGKVNGGNSGTTRRDVLVEAIGYGGGKVEE